MTSGLVETERSAFIRNSRTPGTPTQCGTYLFYFNADIHLCNAKKLFGNHFTLELSLPCRIDVLEVAATTAKSVGISAGRRDSVF
jgi:hypothetical protein